MFTLFALVQDPTDAITNDALINDLNTKFHWVKDYQLSLKALEFPKTTVVDMSKEGWRVRFSIRPNEDMTLSVSEVKKVLGKNAKKLPANFLDYNCEIAIGFGDDPDKLYTDDIIEIGEFIRANYPGVVIYDQYNKDLW